MRCKRSSPLEIWQRPWSGEWRGRCGKCGRDMPLHCGDPDMIDAHESKESA
jgi:hypothetical protein